MSSTGSTFIDSDSIYGRVISEISTTSYTVAICGLSICQCLCESVTTRVLAISILGDVKISILLKATLTLATSTSISTIQILCTFIPKIETRRYSCAGNTLAALRTKILTLCNSSTRNTLCTKYTGVSTGFTNIYTSNILSAKTSIVKTCRCVNTSNSRKRLVDRAVPASVRAAIVIVIPIIKFFLNIILCTKLCVFYKVLGIMICHLFRN